MNIFEAINAMKDGKIVRAKSKLKASYEPCVYKFNQESGSVEMKFFEEDWTPVYMTIHDVLKNDYEFEIYEEKEKLNYYPLWFFIFHNEITKKRFSHLIDDGDYLLNDELSIPAKTDEEARAWARALKTFFELKSHPLITAPHKNEYRSTLMLIGDNLFISSAICMPYQDSNNFCYFESDSHAANVIKDIGEDRIIHMFKTFQGIYE